ncbi:hypothetical protein [Thioclava sp. GXIMD2076]|uniref:Uncharacterized protein n=1 Tax=Thioclava kandeliae TaxID=3070818 RepID=A0ABV1SBU0_9RHOB
MAKVVNVLVVALIAAIVMAGGRWYMYVTNSDTPYDEVGIALNRVMPAPVAAWGCAKLHVTFGKTLPPVGCAAPDGGWLG